MQEIKSVLLSRTDSIGDMVLTLPMAGVIKKHYPHAKVTVLGKTYTQPIVNLSQHVDAFLNWDEINLWDKHKQITFMRAQSFDCVIHVFPNKKIARLAKHAGVAMRIGTSHRWFHWFTCNSLLNFSRKNSDLHESQLNLKLLSPPNIHENVEIKKMHDFLDFSCNYVLQEEIKKLLNPQKLNIVLHPLSKGSARNWGLDNFAELINILPQEKYNIFVSGTEQEGILFRDKLIKPYPFVHDISGKVNLEQFIALINASSALVACSTGPLHIASALDKLAVGLFPPIRPIHAGRWAPIGKNVVVLSKGDAQCTNCKKTNSCSCIESITPQEVLYALETKSSSSLNYT